MPRESHSHPHLPAQPEMLSPASITRVARRAGVSAMTVSRVFRNSPQVSPETRARVETAARELGYRPDPQVARLMELVRSHRARQIFSRLAVIRDESMPAE